MWCIVLACRVEYSRNFIRFSLGFYCSALFLVFFNIVKYHISFSIHLIPPVVWANSIQSLCSFSRVVVIFLIKFLFLFCFCVYMTIIRACIWFVFPSNRIISFPTSNLLMAFSFSLFPIKLGLFAFNFYFFGFIVNVKSATNHTALRTITTFQIDFIHAHFSIYLYLTGGVWLFLTLFSPWSACLPQAQSYRARIRS